MSKEAIRQSATTEAGKINSSEISMQRYLQYLKSDPKPISEEQQYSINPQLDAWRNNPTS